MPLLDQSAEDDWTTGLCKCCEDPAGSCDHVLCYCCQYGRQCSALEGMANTLEPKWAVATLCCGCFNVCFVCQMRGRIRERFGISGNPVTDFLLSWLCHPCAHCLNGRELSNRGYWPGGSLCAREPPGGVG
jgi:Cys-rich protein (TIGR01571 family)